MIRVYRFGVIVAFIVLLSPPAFAQDLLKYRDFVFGMDIESVLKQTKLNPASARTTYSVPDLIQILQWDRQDYFASTADTDSVRRIRFDFYNNQLFRVVAIYNARQLEGITPSDLIAAISKIYGPSSSPDETVVVSPYTAYEDRQKVLARWENGEATYSLFRSSYGGEFGLVGSSRNLEGMALLSIREGERLDALAAPQREIDRQQKLDEERRAQDEKARSVNLPNFRP